MLGNVVDYRLDVPANYYENPSLPGINNDSNER